MQEPCGMLLTQQDRQPVFITTHHPKLGDSPERAIEWMGLIPGWIIYKARGETLRECCKRNYLYGWPVMNGFGVEPDGTLTYPEDPPLPPIAELSTDQGERLISYECGIFAFMDSAGLIDIVRMD